MEQRDRAIQEQTDLGQQWRDRAQVFLRVQEKLRKIVADDEEEAIVLEELRAELGDRYNVVMAKAAHHTERASVLRAHTDAAAKGAPYRKVDRMEILKSVRPGRYES